MASFYPELMATRWPPAPEQLPVQAATFQINPAYFYRMSTFANQLGFLGMRDMPPDEALEGLSSVYFENTPDGGIEWRESTFAFHRQIIAEGFVGNEETQPDPAMTFLGAMVAKRFVVELVRDQTRWDKFRKRHVIINSFLYGNPQPMPRKSPL